MFAGIPRQPAPDRPPPTYLPRHLWRAIEDGDGRVATRYRCAGCQKTTSSLSLTIIQGVCRGPAGQCGFPQILQNPKGHRLAALYGADPSHATLACARCGGWSKGRRGKLHRLCREPNQSGSAALARLARGLMPDGAADYQNAYWVRAGRVTDQAVGHAQWCP